MSPHNWLGLLVAGILLHGAFALSLAALTIRQHLQRRKAREGETRAAEWLASFQSFAGMREKTVRIAVASRASVPPRRASDLLELAEYLVPHFDRPGRTAVANPQRELLSQELRHALVPYLSAEMIQVESMSRARLRRLLCCLRLLAHAPAPELLPLLLSVLTVGDPTLTGEALWAIARGADVYEAATVPLAAAVRDGGAQNAGIVLAAHWTLAQVLTSHPRNIPLLATDPMDSIRCLAMATAGAASAKEDPPVERTAVLERGLEDRVATVRAAAYRSLTEVAPVRAPTLLKAALADPSEEVPLAVLRDLAPSDEPGISAPLVEAFAEAPPRLARLLARALAKTSAPLTPDFVERVSRDPATLEALGHLGRPELAPAILPWLEDPRPVRRCRTAQTLAAMARAAFPGFLEPMVLDRLLLRLTVESEPPAVAGLTEAIAFAADERGVAALMEKIPSAPGPLRERLVEAIAILQRIRPGTVASGNVRV